jgi:DNA gyrase/topoisomerase IV subunit A
MDRPDLSQVAPAVREYIDYLETELLELRLQVEVSTFSERPEPSEEPTTWNVISVSETGVAKRTARHFYSRQRRGGMGVFDLESAEGDYPAHLVIADAAHDLLLFTNLGRVFPPAGDRHYRNGSPRPGQVTAGPTAVSPGRG